METAVRTKPKTIKDIQNQTAKIDEIQRMPERQLLKADQDVKLEAFYPFADFYGGYLVYEINGQKFKMWIGNTAAGQLDVPTIHIYRKSR